ncbi:MAG TPA: dUTP diphosphatase [Acidobacteriota bacterium]|nr:dUTP diphosphatase [Acidobacteriota bacterium]
MKISFLHPDARLPEYQSDGAAGADLYAHLEEDISVPPKGWVLIPTGLALAIPKGYQAEVRARSGLALREGLFVLNGPGTIDSDYRGELKVILANFSDEPRIIHPNDRIAQLIIMPAVRARFVAASINPTSRDSGGFGSTGT